jgi:acetyl esterase/lipase
VNGTEEATMTGSVRTVAYGRDRDQVADLTVPAGAPPLAGWPVVVLIHGGFWRETYRRDLMVPLADDLAARGVASWNVEYRRVGGAGGWPTTLTDTAAAVDHLAVVAEAAPLDLARVAVVGHSAGGQLALWSASRTQLPAGAPGAGPFVRFCLAVGQAPVADLAAGAGLGDGAVGDLLGGDAAEVPERYAVADPVQLVGHGVPVLLVHGEGDDVVPTDQSQRYADAAAVAGDDVQVVVLPGDHFTVIDPASELWAATVEAIAAAC